MWWHWGRFAAGPGNLRAQNRSALMRCDTGCAGSLPLERKRVAVFLDSSCSSEVSWEIVRALLG